MTEQQFNEICAFTSDAKKHTSCHHELKSGEMWVGNTDVREKLSIPEYLISKMQTARLGEQAYYIDGKPIHREYCRPLIIHKSEEMLYNKIMMERISDASKITFETLLPELVKS